MQKQKRIENFDFYWFFAKGKHGKRCKNKRGKEGTWKSSQGVFETPDKTFETGTIWKIRMAIFGT
jgi:hypothetical protein